MFWYVISFYSEMFYWLCNEFFFSNETFPRIIKALKSEEEKSSSKVNFREQMAGGNLY